MNHRRLAVFLLLSTMVNFVKTDGKITETEAKINICRNGKCCQFYDHRISPPSPFYDIDDISRVVLQQLPSLFQTLQVPWFIHSTIAHKVPHKTNHLPHEVHSAHYVTSDVSPSYHPPSSPSSSYDIPPSESSNYIRSMIYGAPYGDLRPSYQGYSPLQFYYDPSPNYEDSPQSYETPSSPPRHVLTHENFYRKPHKPFPSESQSA